LFAGRWKIGQKGPRQSAKIILYLKHAFVADKPSRCGESGNGAVCWGPEGLPNRAARRVGGLVL
jgi:hypothetical protein